MAEKLEIVIWGKDKFSSTFNKLKSHMPSLKTAAIGTAAAIGGISTALYAIAKSTATSYDKIQKLSDQLGVSTEFLSKMNTAADFSGIKIETMNKAIQKTQIGIAEAARGIGIGKEAFETLGVTLHTTTGRLKTAEDIMPELAEKFNNLTDATQKTELASKLFGQRGVEMLQMFTNGKEGLAAMSAEAEKFGLVISKKAGANAALFNDSLTRLQGSFKGIKNTIAEKLFPVLTGLQNRFANFIAENQDGIIEFGEKFLITMGHMLEKGAYVIAFLADAWRGWLEIWEILKIGFSSLSIFIWEGLNAVRNKLTETLEALNYFGMFDAAIENSKRIAGEQQQIIGFLNEQLETAKENLRGLAEQPLAMEQVTETMDKIRNAIAEIRAEGGVSDEEEPVGIAPFTTAELEKTQENMELHNEALMLELEQLGTMYDDFIMTDLQKIDKWYKDQQVKFKGNNDALYKARVLYLGKKKKLDDATDKAELATTLKKKQNNEAIQKELFDNLTGMATMFGEKGKRIALIMSIPKALMSMYTGAAKALELPFPANLAAASTVLATGAGFVSSIKSSAAHGGMTNVPKEQTYLLDRGERVLSPNQNKDFTDFISDTNGSVVIENLNIHVLENATNADAMLSMDRRDWEEVCNDQIVPAFKVLKAQGVTV